jgi:hypothetical protein
MQAEVMKWFEAKKQFYASDSIKKAMREGRAFLRTFAKDAITKSDEKLDLAAFSADGLVSLQHLAEQMYPVNLRSGDKTTKDEEKRAKNKEARAEEGYSAIPFNSLSAKPFHSKERYGVLITMPKEEDLQQFKKYTNKNFVKKHNIDPNLVEQMKGYFTRASYYNPIQDLWSSYHKDENKTLPSKAKPIPTTHSFLEFSKEELKNFAYNFQSVESSVNLLNLTEHTQQFREEYLSEIESIKSLEKNEILIKPRQSSKVAIVCFNKEELEDLKANKDIKNLFPEGSRAFCAYYDKANKSLHINEKQTDLTQQNKQTSLTQIVI